MMTLCIHWDTFWAAITAVATTGLLTATILLVYYGKKQLKTLNETNKENFLHQLKNDFFTKEARELLVLVEYNLLTFKLTKLNENSEQELAFFEAKLVENVKAKEVLKSILTNRTNFSSYEMDDFLLQHLEDLGFLFKKKIVDLYNIDQLFGYYIVIVFENCEIKKYIEWTKQDDKDIYSNFEYVYHKLKLYHGKN